MIFYDFEVFKYDWLVVLIDMANKEKKIIVNSAEELTDYYEKHNNDIWVGYNSKHYDQYILKSILLGIDPKFVNDEIIVNNKKGWEINRDFNKIKFFNYDVMNRGDPSLKTLEGYMGHNIKESQVDFKIDRKLTSVEISEVIKYCEHDVEQLIEVFLRRQNSFTSHLDLATIANNGKLSLSLLNKTKTQLAGILLNAIKKNYSDEFDLIIPNNLEIKKYRECVDWYMDEKNRCYITEKIGKSGKKLLRKNQLNINIANVPHVLGYGGIHGAIDKYHGTGKFLNMDVTSLYPTLMIEYNLLSRSVPDPKDFQVIYQKNLDLKAQNLKAKREPYKLTCNSTYGAMKDKYNPLYDPKMANNVCVHGQLFLVDLIEHLEPYCEIIQSNTDGILIKYYTDEDLININSVTKEWEERTNLELEFEYFKEIYQKDVNNYVFIPDGDLYDNKGKPRWTTKGGFVKKLNDLDNDLPIINQALVNYMTQKIPIEKTINSCDKLKDFQMVRKISGKYDHIKHGEKILNERCVRIFASKSITDGGIFQKSKRTGNYEKIKDSPTRCFLNNDDINNMKPPIKLDRKFYINLAYRRLNLFGVNYD